jgi:hypothetical protein
MYAEIIISVLAGMIAGGVLTRLYLAPTLARGKAAEQHARDLAAGLLSKLSDKIK